VVVALIGVDVAVRPQVAVTVKVPVTQLVVPPVTNVSLYAPAADTVAESKKTVVPAWFVICRLTAVPEPGPGDTLPVIVPVAEPLYEPEFVATVRVYVVAALAIAGERMRNAASIVAAIVVGIVFMVCHQFTLSSS
jgi:hypothetical protein